MIIECPLNGQYHDRRDVILTSQMGVSNNVITVTVIQNIVIAFVSYLTALNWPNRLAYLAFIASDAKAYRTAVDKIVEV